MFLHGEIIEVGVGDMRDGVSLQIANCRQIIISGLTHSELREFGRMLFHRVTIKVESLDDRQRFDDEQPAPKPKSNIDEETGIKKTGEI